jgi:hypothetical protein
LDDVVYENIDRNYPFQGISSAYIQTARQAGLFHNEKLFSNMLSIVKNDRNKTNTLIPISDKIKDKNQKFYDDSKSKYKKFVGFIKDRHFKSYANKKKKYQSYYPTQYNLFEESNAFNKINGSKSLFLTQDLGKHPKKQENKLLQLYKRIFNNDLEEAKVYNNIKLVPFLGNDVNDQTNQVDYDEGIEIEAMTGSNFHTKYSIPSEDHTFRLMKKRSFLNFHTNPKTKKGYNRGIAQQLNDSQKPGHVRISLKTCDTFNEAPIHQHELKQTNIKVMIKSDMCGNTPEDITDRSAFNRRTLLRELKNKSSAAKLPGADSNLMTVNENLILGKQRDLSKHTKVEGEIQNNSKLPGKVSSKQLTKKEISKIIKSKQNHFKQLKKKVMDNYHNNKEVEMFQKLRENHRGPTLQRVEVSEPFLSKDRSKSRKSLSSHKAKKGMMVNYFDDQHRERKMNKALYNIFDKEEVDYVLKRNDF